MIQRDGLAVYASLHASGQYPTVRIWFPYDRAAPLARADGASSAYRDGPAPVLSAPRPLAIELRPETSLAESKMQGVERDVQTGDKRFDDAVYVDTTTDDAVVSRLLEPAEVRDAVRELLALGAVLTLDDAEGNVIAGVGDLDAYELASPYAERAIEAMLLLARTLPVVASSGEAKQDRFTSWMSYALPLALGAGFVLFFFLPMLAPAACYEHKSRHAMWAWPCLGPRLIGLLLGVLLGAAVGWLTQRLVRPSLHSDSSKRICSAIWLAFALTADIVLIVVSLVGWYLVSS